MSQFWHLPTKENVLKLSNLSAALLLAGLGMSTQIASAAVSDDVIRIGYITDMSGVYADIDGPAGAEAIRMAIEDAGGSINGKKIEFRHRDRTRPRVVRSEKSRRVDRRHQLRRKFSAGNRGC